MEMLPAMDRERLMRVSRGSLERAREFFGALANDAQVAFDRLRDALDAADERALHDVAHSLKGMALEVGAPRLAAAAAALETEPDPARWRGHLDAVGSAVVELREALETL